MLKATVLCFGSASGCKTLEKKKRSQKRCAATAAVIDAQPSPGTAGQPEITQGTSTPRARAAGQPYRLGLTGELPSTPSTQRADNIAP